MDIKLEDGEHNLYACKNYIMRVGTIPIIILDVRDQLVEYAIMCDYTVAAGLATYKKGTIFIRPIAEAGLTSITAEEYEDLVVTQHKDAPTVEAIDMSCYEFSGNFDAYQNFDAPLNGLLFNSDTYEKNPERCCC